MTCKQELEKSAADIKTEEINQYVTALEKQLVSVTKHAENLVKRSRETAMAFYEFGQSFSFMGQCEGDTVGAALAQLGSTADNLAGSAHTFAENEVVKLVEPLEEYSRMLQSIKMAMQQRAAKKTAYTNCLVDVEAKTQAYRKLQGVTGKEQQAELKEQAVSAAQDAADAAKLEFEKVSERLLTEFELFKNQKAFDIKEIMTNFVNLQVSGVVLFLYVAILLVLIKTLFCPVVL
jgi:sorting nexin-1/2